MEKETKEKLFNQLALIEKVSKDDGTAYGVFRLSIAMAKIAELIFELENKKGVRADDADKAHL